MLLIASEISRGSHALNNVAREMSFSASYFASAESLSELMSGRARRIVLLTESDVNDGVVTCLESSVSKLTFGVVVAANREALRSSTKAEYVDRLSELPNTEWVVTNFDFESLAGAARDCRRHMLKLSRRDLESAFKRDEFVIRYQPKVERNAGSEWLTQEAEALVRWQHPEDGIIGPLEFLPEIEAFDMMGRLTETVLDKAAAQLAQWRDEGLSLNGCVNLAPSQLTDSSLGERYAEIVQKYGVECGRFTFEVVEQDLADPEAPHLKALQGLRERGFRLCLDDFRVAAASLGTFEQLPFDEIKIHASSLRHAQEDRVAMHVLAAVTGLAHNLGMSVCAEGVEDQETFEFLKTIECDKMQGFLISEAVLPHIIRRVYSGRTGNEVEDVA